MRTHALLLSVALATACGANDRFDGEELGDGDTVEEGDAPDDDGGAGGEEDDGVGGGGGGGDDGREDPGSLRDCSDGGCDGSDDDPGNIGILVPPHIIVPPCDYRHKCEQPPLCGPTEVQLLGGQTIDVGRVMVSTIRSGLRVDAWTAEPWQMDLVHLYVGVDLPKPNPGSYPFAAEPEDGTRWSITIPVDLIDGAACGESVLVAFHADVHATLDGEVCDEETAWAEAEYPFGLGWGGFFEVDLCC